MLLAGLTVLTPNPPPIKYMTSAELNLSIAEFKAQDAAFFTEAFTNPVTRQPYEVPEDIKRCAIRLCRSYGIRGICDPMYFANIIALETGRGDGKSHFLQSATPTPKERTEMKTNKIKIGVEKVGRTGLTASEFDRSVTLRKGMRVAVVGTETVGTVEKICGEEVTYTSDTGATLTEKVKFLRAVL